MLRRVFTFASALSLLLCAGIATLWVRSYLVENIYQRSARQDGSDGTVIVMDGIIASRGELCLRHIKLRFGQGPWPRAWKTPDLTWAAISRNEGWRNGPVIRSSMSGIETFAGFHYSGTITHIADTSAVHEMRLLVLPYWFLFAMTAVLPVWWSRAAIRARAKKAALAA